VDQADFARYNAKGFKAWLTELDGFCHFANDWAMVRAGVFNELNTALEHRNDIAGVLNLARSLVK
jgi:lysyl-tRNA synthetase class I